MPELNKLNNTAADYLLLNIMSSFADYVENCNMPSSNGT